MNRIAYHPLSPVFSGHWSFSKVAESRWTRVKKLKNAYHPLSPVFSGSWLKIVKVVHDVAVINPVGDGPDSLTDHHLSSLGVILILKCLGDPKVASRCMSSCDVLHHLQTAGCWQRKCLESSTALPPVALLCFFTGKNGLCLLFYTLWSTSM